MYHVLANCCVESRQLYPEVMWSCSERMERYLRHWATPLMLGRLWGKWSGSGSRREEEAASRADSSNSDLVMVEQRTGRAGDADRTGGTGLATDQANLHYLDSGAAFLSRVRRRQFGKSRSVTIKQSDE